MTHQIYHIKLSNSEEILAEFGDALTMIQIAVELAPKVVDIDLKGVYPGDFLKQLGALGGLDLDAAHLVEVLVNKSTNLQPLMVTHTNRYAWLMLAPVALVCKPQL